MNIYKFIENKDRFQLVVSNNLSDAAKLCTIDYNKVKVLYKNVIVDTL